MEPNTNNQTWMSRLKEQLFGKKTEPQTTTQTEVKPPVQDADAGKRTAKTVPDIPSPFDNLGLSEGDGNLVPATLKEHFNILYNQFKALGEQKGRLGHDDIQTIDALAQSEASIFHERVKAEVGGRVNALKINLDCDEEHRRIMEDAYKQQKRYYNALENERMLNSNSFSWVTAILYFLSGVILLFADCALALNLMAKAFRLEAHGGTHSLSKLGTNATLPILVHNWQVVLTSIGIAFLSIYIKIFYDEYIGTADGIRQIRFNRVKDLIKDKEETEVQQQLDMEVKIKLAVRILILSCTFLLLFLLSRLRYYAEIALENNPSGVFTKYPETWWAIFMLTLLFPMVAGVCFSLALKVWQNNRSYCKSKKGMKNAKKSLEEAIKKHLMSQKQYENAKATLKDWIDTNQFLPNTRNYLLAAYKNGYWVDYVNPETSDTIQDIVERMTDFRNKTAARRNLSQLYNTK